MPVKTPRPTKDIQTSITSKVTTGCGNLYITICRDKTGITEILSKLGKSGCCACAQVECLSAVLSTSIKAGVDPQELIKDLIGVRCNTPVTNDGLGEDIYSCGDAIGKCLKHYLKEIIHTVPVEIQEPDIDSIANLFTPDEEADIHFQEVQANALP
jgi:ribonucleoside-diphosphate reductase alpha chain